MKPTNKRRFFYPIRAALLLLICSLLFTGCMKADEKPFYKGTWGSSRVVCRAVRSDTNIFDLDHVTLEWHFNVEQRQDIIPETGEIIREPNTPFDLYFYANRETRFFIKRVEDAFDKKRLQCDPEKNHEGGVWETYTVPREVFADEKGWFYFVVVRPATDEKAESIVWKTLAIFYEKIGKDKVRLDTWGAVYPTDTNEAPHPGIIIN